MKKLLCTLCCLAMVLGLFPAALAIDQDEYSWREYTVKLLEILDPPMFAPADMTDDQRAIALRLEMPQALADDEALADAIYHEALLTDRDGHSYKPGAALQKENVLTYLYSIPKDADLDALRLSFAGETPAASAVNFAAFAGTWEGQTGNIHLTFTVQKDGKGSYTFEQSGYKESYEVALSADDQRFVVDIPANNALGITSCEGNWAYENEVLTLDVVTTFRNGRQFTYSIPCKRVQEKDAEKSLDPKFLGRWQGEDQNVKLIFDFLQDGSLTIASYPEGAAASGSWWTEENKLYLIQEGQTEEEFIHYSFTDEGLLLSDPNSTKTGLLTRVQD